MSAQPVAEASAIIQISSRSKDWPLERTQEGQNSAVQGQQRFTDRVRTALPTAAQTIFVRFTTMRDEHKAIPSSVGTNRAKR
jgi:hypothetical protein